MGMQRTILASALLWGLAAQASAACPPMSVYTISGLTAADATLGEIMPMMFEGTAWQVEVSDDASAAHLDLRGVTGPLHKVFAKVMEVASAATAVPLTSVADVENCVVRVTSRTPTKMVERVIEDGGIEQPARLLADFDADVLRAGSRLSNALEGYVTKRHWQLRWLIEQDYVLDVDVPVPPLDVIDGVTYIVTAYQAQGGLRGVVPRFARANSVVVIEKMDVRDNEEQGL